jgi:thioredoxin reductase (NADPH)
MERWELVIIGAGAAGLTAGIYGARSGLKTLVLEEQLPGGMTATSPWIENYPGFPEGITGTDLAEKMLGQCRMFGVEVRDVEGVIEMDLDGEKKIVKTAGSEYEAEAVIIASGSRHKTLGVPGEEEFRGKGVSYCAVCDGFFFKEKKVLVVGGGNNAATSALYLDNLGSEVYLAHRRDLLRAEEAYMKELAARKVRFLWNTEVTEVRGDMTVKSVVLFDNRTEKTEEMKVDGVFILVGESPNSDFAKKAGVKVDEQGYILVDSLQRTNILGVYAAGDVTSCPVKQIGTAVGQAIIAATEAFGYIKKPYYYR